PGGVVLAERIGDVASTALPVVAVQADQLGAGSDREQRFDRLVHVRAHEVVEVAPVQLIPSNPAASRIPRVVSGLPSENGPGPQVSASASSGRERKRSTTCSVSAQNGLSVLRRQQTFASLPPGLSAPRIARIAGTGAAKNWVPMREKA